MCRHRRWRLVCFNWCRLCWWLEPGVTNATICCIQLERCKRSELSWLIRYRLEVISPFEQYSIGSCCLSSLRKENEQCLHDFTIVGLSHGGEGISLLEELDDRKNGALLRKPDTLIGELEISRSGGASFLASIKDMMRDSGIPTRCCWRSSWRVSTFNRLQLHCSETGLFCEFYVCFSLWTDEVNVKSILDCGLQYTTHLGDISPGCVGFFRRTLLNEVIIRQFWSSTDRPKFWPNLAATSFIANAKYICPHHKIEIWTPSSNYTRTHTRTQAHYLLPSIQLPSTTTSCWHNPAIPARN